METNVETQGTPISRLPRETNPNGVDVAGVKTGRTVKVSLDTMATKDDINILAIGMIFKPSVPTFSALATTYPTPEKGWAAIVEDEGFIYQFDGTNWNNTGLTAFPTDVATQDELELRALTNLPNGSTVVYDDKILSSTGKNKFDKRIIIDGKGVQDNGSILNIATWSIAYIPLKANKLYSFIHDDLEYRAGSVGALVFCDANMQEISHVNMSTLPFSSDGRGKLVTTPANCAFILKNIKIVLAGLTRDYTNTFQIEEGGTSTSYEPYFRPLNEIVSKKLSLEQPSYRISKNLYDSSRLLNGGIDNLGAITTGGAYANWRYTIIHVNAGEQYAFLHDDLEYGLSTVGALLMRDSANTTLQVVNMASLPNSRDGKGKILTIPTGCTHILKNVKTIVGSVTRDYTNTLSFEKGDMCTIFEKFGNRIQKIDSFDIDSLKLLDISVEPSKNLYYNLRNAIGGINNLGEIVVNSATAEWRYTKIEVSEGNKYSFRHYDNEYRLNNVGALLMRDSANTTLQVVDMNSLPISKDGLGRTLTAPAGCTHILKNVKVILSSGVIYDYTENFQFEKGDTCTTFEKFGNRITAIKNTPLKNSDSVIPLSSNRTARIPLKWTSVGDSITWLNNNTSANVAKGYQTNLIERYNIATHINKGINGGGSDSLIAEMGTWTSSDIYTIMIGTNDWGYRNIALGTIADFKNNTANGTYYANMRKIIDRIYSLNSKTIVILMTSPFSKSSMGDNFEETTNSLGLKLSDFVNACKEISKVANIPLVNNYEVLNPYNITDFTYDNLHPNTVGMQRLAHNIAHVFERCIETIY